MNRELLRIGMSEFAGTKLIRLTGELDSYTSDRLSTIPETWSAGLRKIIVNLDGLESIDSTGLSALVGIWVKAMEVGAQMVLSCHKPRIHKILRITGLLNLFNINSASPEARLLFDSMCSHQGLRVMEELEVPAKLCA